MTTSPCRQTLCQSQYRRHRRAPLPRWLQPPAEICAADRAGRAGTGPEDTGAGARLGAMGAVLLRNQRQRRKDRPERSRLGSVAGAGTSGPRRAGALPGASRHIRRCRPSSALHRRLLGGTRQPLVPRHPRHARALSRRRGLLSPRSAGYVKPGSVPAARDRSRSRGGALMPNTARRHGFRQRA